MFTRSGVFADTDTHLVVEPGAFLQGAQVSLSDAQLKGTAEDEVRVLLSQGSTHLHLHLLPITYTHTEMHYSFGY